MKGQELIDFIIDKFDGVMIDDYGWEHHKINNILTDHLDILKK